MIENPEISFCACCKKALQIIDTDVWEGKAYRVKCNYCDSEEYYISTLTCSCCFSPLYYNFHYRFCYCSSYKCPKWTVKIEGDYKDDNYIIIYYSKYRRFVRDSDTKCYIASFNLIEINDQNLSSYINKIIEYHKTL